MLLSKYQCRQHFLNLRAQLKADYREAAAMSAARHFVQTQLFSTSVRIACYLPFKEEINTLPTIEAIWQAHKQCYLPVLTKEKSLFFVAYRYGDSLIKNRYGIYEPKIHKDILSAKELDVVLMPLIAFDQTGVRLGTGGGYYDKTFSFMLSDGGKLVSSPHMIGIGFAVQEAKSPLPKDPWDITMEAVITEQGVVTCE